MKIGEKFTARIRLLGGRSYRAPLDCVVVRLSNVVLQERISEILKTAEKVGAKRSWDATCSDVIVRLTGSWKSKRHSFGMNDDEREFNMQN